MKKLILLSIIVSVSACSTGRNFAVKLDKPQVKKNEFRVTWAKDLDPKYSTGNLPIGTASPFIHDDIVYMGDLRGMMTAYDIDSGKILWQFDEKAPIQSQVNKKGDFIYYGSKTGRFFSRHYLTGKLNFAVDLGAPIESQAVFSQGRAIIHLRNHSILSLDASTGKVFWRYKRSIPYSTTLQRVSHVLPYENSLIVGFADGHVASLSIEEGVLKWEQRISVGYKFVDVDVKPVIFDKYIIVGSASGPLRFLNPKNGVIEKTIELTQSHTPKLMDSEFIVGDTDGYLYRINSFGKITLKKRVSINAISSVKSWKNGLAVSTMGEEILFLNDRSFEPVDKFLLGSSQSAVFGELVTNNEHLSVYSSRNRLYVFK
jgi:outer membrane protein assembly factor BamB